MSNFRPSPIGLLAGLGIAIGCVSAPMPQENFECMHSLVVANLACGLLPLSDHVTVAPLECTARPAEPGARAVSCTSQRQQLDRKQLELDLRSGSFGTDWGANAVEVEPHLKKVTPGNYQLYATYTYEGADDRVCQCVSEVFSVPDGIVLAEFQ